MIRVLTLCEYPSLNGGEHSLIEVVRHLDRGDFEIIVAAPAEGPVAARLSSLGIARVPLRIRDRRGVRLDPARLRQHLADLTRQCRPDVIHANSVAMSRLAGPLSRDLGIPGVGHLRDIMRLSRAGVEQLNCLCRTLAVSQATRDWYVAAGLDADRAVVEHNGVDLNRFRPRAPTGYAHALLDLNPRLPLVGTIGQLGVRKGTDTFVEMAGRVARTCPEAHFVVVGQRYSRKDEARAFECRVRQAATAEALRGRVHFLGVRDDIDRLLNELTLYVHLARQEPLGRVLLEAAASGTPVVATAVGGTGEIFLSGPEGAAELVAPQDGAAAARAVLTLLDSPARRAELAGAARRRCQARFDVRTATRRLEQHYHELAALGR